jgi:cell division protease FtsH
VNEADFSRAIERLVAGLEQKSKVMNPQEKERIAYHEMGHATVALGLNCADKIHKISIIPRGMGSLGYTLQRPTEDRYVLDETELLDKIAVLLGGRASETIFCGSASTGAADDLAKATDIARAMVTQFGMSEKLGMVVLETKHATFLQSPFETSQKMLSEKTAGAVDIEIKAIIGKSLQRAIRCLQKNRTFIHVSMQKLLQAETLDSKDIEELWNKHGKSAAAQHKAEEEATA